jgi:outer membrane lipoprotein SlyB
LQQSTLFMCLSVGAAIAGCAPTNAPMPPAISATAPNAPATGTIVSMRKVSAQPSSSSWRSALLADAATTGAATDAVGSGLMEFIVRASDGTIISVVQSNDVGFHTGERIVILRDGPTHLARPG